MAGFIAAQRVEHQVPYATACRALGVSQAWFYKWRDGDASPRHARRAQLSEAIKQLFAAHHGKFGSPRITDDLRELDALLADAAPVLAAYPPSIEPRAAA